MRRLIAYFYIGTAFLELIAHFGECLGARAGGWQRFIPLTTITSCTTASDPDEMFNVLLTSEVATKKNNLGWSTLPASVAPLRKKAIESLTNELLGCIDHVRRIEAFLKETIDERMVQSREARTRSEFQCRVCL